MEDVMCGERNTDNTVNSKSS
ncbi:unnamed protein product, partial [Didymodactylos carnosus]